MLYDADKIAEAASVENEQDLYDAKLGVFLDPNDPEGIAEARCRDSRRLDQGRAKFADLKNGDGMEDRLSAASRISHLADAGHLVGLLTPIQIFDFLGISHEAKQLMAIGLGGIAGLMALVGGGLLLHRRLFDPRIRAHSTLADTGIMVLLMAQK